ncbi:MAG: glycosyltransferase family 39 protein [Candidatus Pacebacteria bacterium]|nr:glycosyltransferase family 39 protein [Candidatus Paceibacterota bacterium]
MIRKTYIFALVILLCSAFLRLYRFETFVEFLDDQGRDAIIMKKILVNHDITLLGPGTSVGKMYLGPLYYYVMSPFLALTYPSPIGPAVAVALLGVMTSVGVYLVGRNVIGEYGARVGAVLYTFSPIVIKLSRFSWQPNPAPFVGLMMMWWTYKAVQEKNPWYWVGVATCFAVLTHLHYVALLSALPTVVVLIYDLRRSWGRVPLRTMVSIALCCLGILILSILPLFAFDLRHDHLIVKGFMEFSQDQQRSSPLLSRIWQAIVDSHGRSMQMTVELYGFSKEMRGINTLVVGILTVLFVYVWKQSKKTPKLFHGMTIVGLWMALSLVGMSIYRDTMYFHYFGFLFPISFLFGGAALAWAMQKNVWIKNILSLSILVFITYLVVRMPYWTEDPLGFRGVRSVSQNLTSFIKPGQKYNIALLNDNREYRAMKYRYFFEVSKVPAQTEYQYTGLDTLIVLVENGEDPVGSPIFEIQQFMREHPKSSLLTVRDYPGIVKAYVYTAQ